jgi:hypothetical protein
MDITFYPAGQKSKAGRSPAKKDRPASIAIDPKAARSPTIALLRGRGQEDRRPTMTPQQNSEQQPSYKVRKYGSSRYWAVVDAAGALVCVTVYKRGAEEVVRLLRG